MANLSRVRNFVVGELEPLVRKIESREFSRDGRYFQVSRTHETPPDGDSPPDRIGERLHDQGKSLSDVLSDSDELSARESSIAASLLSTSEFSLRIDVHERPQGQHGWRARAMVTDGGITMALKFSDSSGPGSWESDPGG